jgi:hypothetical protein
MYGGQTIYTNYENYFLKVEENGNLVVYSRITIGFRSRQL